MNLINDQWIPVILENGESRLVGLNELYRRATEIRDIVVTPPQRISLMRLLICITQAALGGPEDEEDWYRCRQRIVPESLRYFNERTVKFELYGDQPFLQVRDLVPRTEQTLDKLDFGLAAGHNPTLFDHGGSPQGRAHSPGWCALMLVTYQCFSPGGTISEATWSGKQVGGTSEDAPCVKNTPLYLIIRGSNLLNTIHYNLITKREVESLPGRGWGMPIWDAFPSGPESDDENLTLTYLGRLMPLSRAILLKPDKTKIALTNGISYPSLPVYRESTATVFIDRKDKKQEQTYLPVDLEKHPWRELASILTLAPGRGSEGPLTLRHLNHLSPKDHIDIWTGGLAKKKGDIIDVGEWNFSIPISLIGTQSLEKYREGTKLANLAFLLLREAVKKYSEKYFESLAKIEFQIEIQRSRRIATSHFWSCLDNEYGKLIEAANDTHIKLGDAWYPIVREAMEEAYDRGCPHEPPRQIQAYAQGLRSLRLKKPLD